MTTVNNTRQIQPQERAPEQRTEQRDAGEQATREFTQAMKKDTPSDKKPLDSGAGEKKTSSLAGLFTDAPSASTPPQNGQLADAAGKGGEPVPQKLPEGMAREAAQTGTPVLNAGPDQLRARRETGQPGIFREDGRGLNQAASGQAKGGQESMLNTSAFSLLGRGEQKKDGQQKSPEDGFAGMMRGDAVLAGLAPKEPAPVSGPSAVETPRIDADMTARLVDRILVSAADAKGNAEVRISLREDVLPGTEIRIQRQMDGGIAVQFVTGDIRAEQMLGSRQISDLQNILAQSMQVEVRVTTIRTDGSMSADAGTGGQQQGRQGQGGQDGQPHDGRSRQHDLFDGLREDDA